MKGWLAMLGALLLVQGCGGGGGDSGISISIYFKSGLQVADFNRDGRADVLLASTLVDRAPPHAGSVNLFLHAPAGGLAFDPLAAHAAGNDPRPVLVADVNGDGLPDLVVITDSLLFPASMALMLNNAAQPGRFLPPRAVALPSGFSPYAAVAIDLDGDGRLDLAVSGNAGVALLRQNPAASGSFLAPVLIPSASYVSGIDVGDMNGDGVPDIVAITGGQLVVLFQNQNPAVRMTFSAPVSLGVGGSSSFVRVADLDGDGKADLVTGLDLAGRGNVASLAVVLHDPVVANGFLPLQVLQTVSGVASIVVADVNGDGRPDILAGGFLGVTVLAQSLAAVGAFQAPVTYAPSYSGGGRSTSFTYDFSSFAVADLDGDGLPDIVMTCGPSTAGGASDCTPGVMLQDTPGRFLPPRDIR
jgi:hypothetical protein